MQKSRFDSLNTIVKRRRRWIVIGWVVLVLVSVSFLPNFFSHVSYDITGGIGGPSNTESDRAQKILNAEFPSSASNASSHAILVLLQGPNPYSDSVKNTLLALNKTLANNPEIANYTGLDALYTVEIGLLNSTLPSVITQDADLEANITSISQGIYSLVQNLSTLSSNIFQLEKGINQTAQLVYGIPLSFVQIWSGVEAQGVTNPYVANAMANSSLYQLTNNLGGNVQSIGYYSTFYTLWNSTFQALPSNTTAMQRESVSINQTLHMFLSNPSLDNDTRQTMELVGSLLNVSDWNQENSISNLTVSTIATSIPSELTSSFGISAKSLVTQLYEVGPSPSNETLSQYSIRLFANSFPTSLNSGSGFSVSELLNSVYNLGISPTFSEKWNLASSLIANSTKTAFDGSPLFAVNSTALAKILTTLSPGSTLSQINAKINGIVSNDSYLNYPLVPLRAISQNFVSKDNASTLAVLNFASSSDANTIAQVQSAIKNSGLETMGTVYVTGGTVISQDVQDIFTPALGITVGPGVIVSILIVGALFLSPVAAIIPILMGGISIAVALPAIYFEIVVLGHGHITFLTPTLTILLMLGLAVDYAVLQLRRTREERLEGKSLEDSVGISVRWAGQAVLTAGITVIVAYIVMAVANVPLFSSVGTAIALGVTILLVASLTLLPALELILGDKMFWPGLSRKKNKPLKSRLQKITEVTLRRKLGITTFISLIAIGAFYTSYHTPVGEDFLKLVPNFPSNQGLTALTEAFGGGQVFPTQVLVVLPSPIVYGHDQFNQTLLNEVEQISNVAANSSGVVSVAGPTRPYGSLINYSSIGNMPETLRLQYESGMLAFVGKDNKTVLINVGLSNSSESQAAVDSLLGMERNIVNLQISNGLTLYYDGG
ncbi:MAG: MMPL family transporter, partial [Nitrososphaerota archaeon]|nr:MMPL family transporter [Nitrososphaerota archaeon]